MMRTQARRPPARRGIALIVTLVVVMLITAFLTELSFTTGLELRTVQTFKERAEARALARAAFKAIQIGLLGDEVEFMVGYRQLSQRLQFLAVPWEDGLLVDLEVQPLDPLFNLNRFPKLREGSEKFFLFHEVFQNLLSTAIPEPDEFTVIVQPLDEDAVSIIYAEIVDWLDVDDLIFTYLPGIQGAEQSAYFGETPELRVKNGALDRLKEIRAVRSIGESRIFWEDWQARFTIYERKDGNLYPGLINPNVASSEEIVAFLEARRITEADTEILSGGIVEIQERLNEYADKAGAIAEELQPAEGQLPDLSMGAIRSAIQRANANPGLYEQVFSTVDEYFRIAITTEVNEVQAHLEAVVHTPRNAADRTASSVEVLEFTLD